MYHSFDFWCLACCGNIDIVTGLSLLCPIIYNLLKDGVLGFSIASFILLPRGRGWGFISVFFPLCLKSQDFSRPRFRKLSTNASRSYRLSPLKKSNSIRIEFGTEKTDRGDLVYVHMCIWSCSTRIWVKGSEIYIWIAEYEITTRWQTVEDSVKKNSPDAHDSYREILEIVI